MNIGKIFLILLLVLIGISITAVLYLGITSSTKPFKDTAGKQIEGSIARLEELEINGLKQWILIRGKDKNNPVLLWLHSGPGTAQMPWAHHNDSLLEEHFVVVHWDQRGAGKSNHRDFNINTMTVQQYKDDALVLIEHLADLFNQNKIFLLGHSWGTQLGIELVYENPELIHAYISVGQVVDHARAIEIATAWLKAEMEKAGDEKGLTKLQNIENPALYHSDYRELAQMVIAYGGNITISMGEMALIAFQAREYNFIDYFRLLNSMNRGGGPLHPDGIMKQYNYIQSIPKIEIPVYFFIGRNDYNTPFMLVEEYYQILEAPYKELVVFEQSAHTPFFSEPEKFNRELIKIAD